VKRVDTTEIKEWEALAGYVKKLNDANSNAFPDTYKLGTGTFPRRATCTGTNATNGFCSH
jgi:hypothetical protein